MAKEATMFYKYLTSLLSADVVSAPTVATFKKRLDDFWAQSRYG